MTAACYVYIATSVDGFIAKPDGGIDWLHHPDYSDGSLNGLSYEEFISTIDALVMGRHTFEKVLSFKSWPYGDMPVTVLTSRPLDIPHHLLSTVSVDRGAPREIAGRLSADGKKHLYIDGGITIRRFLAAGLIRELTITRIPVLLGEGIPLFGANGPEQRLQLTAVAQSENGMVQVRYSIPVDE